MTLKDQIISDMTAAMKAKDDATLNVQRNGAIDEIEKDCKEKTQLRCEVVTLYRGAAYWLYRYRVWTVEQYQKAGRQDLVDKETAEITVIEFYLPQAASEAEIEQAVTDAISETGATSMKEMGAVMKAAMAKLTGKNADGRIVSETVKKKLAS